LTSHGPPLCFDRVRCVSRRAVLGLAVALAARRSAGAETVRRIGILGDTPGPQWEAFRDALRDLGYVEGTNIAIESRYSLGDSSRFSDLAVELIQKRVDVVVAEGGLATAAAKKASNSVPIVMTIVGDPVGSGLVASLARPGGNITGLSVLSTDLAGKRLDLLRQLVPGLRRVAIMGNVDNPVIVQELSEYQAAGRALDLNVITSEIRRVPDIALAIDALKGNADALYVCQDLLTFSNWNRINTLTFSSNATGI